MNSLSDEQFTSFVKYSAFFPHDYLSRLALRYMEGNL